MALAGAFAHTATRLLRGGLQLLRPAAAVPALSLRINRQLCDAPAAPALEEDELWKEAEAEITAAEKPPALEEDESWKEAEAEILRDVEPVVEFVQNILHSDRYGYGGCISPDDQKFVVEKLLSHHPRSEEKIGCGVDAIMVDKHPSYMTRCLFVLRTNGGLEEFSYRKCLRAYLERKYPSHADRFLQKHFQGWSSEK